MTPSTPTILALVLAIVPAAARAQAPSAGDGIALRAGDTVQFDLTALPSRYEGAGKATCTGTVIKATGLEAAVCERTYRFEVPSGASRMTYLFRATAGGQERRIELPLTRQRRPIDFAAPSDGALLPPAPVTIPAEVADRAARSTAEAQCAQCGDGFALKSFQVTKPPVAVDGSPSIGLKITSTGRPPVK
ncbi:MAG TPA: hypothetical protein VLT61_05610 [Anaeromyxobacteraceae bacterium]|nr:hypothetical protein [Anaeromyxobacteraceae bacterium]